MKGLSERVAGDQIPGARDYQEDDLRITKWRKGDARVLLFVLADGMGGHAGGERAAKLAVETFTAHFEKADADAAPGPRLREALDAANAVIGEDAAQDPRYADMGCTLLACLVANGVLHWISVGDSPLWLLRDAQITRLNADHSMRPVLEGLVEIGRMSAADLAQDPRINQLRSAVMGDELALVDQNPAPFTLTNGDRVILASDGMETLTTDEIAALCNTQEDSAHTVSALLNAVETRRRLGQDNATVAVYQHEDSTE